MEKTKLKRIKFDEMPNVIAQLSLDILEMSNSLQILMDEMEGLREHVMAKPVSARRIPVDIDRACEIIGKAKNTMYRYTSQGLIPHYKRGKTIYFLRTNCSNGFGTVASRLCWNGRKTKTKISYPFKLNPREPNSYNFPFSQIRPKLIANDGI